MEREEVRIVIAIGEAMLEIAKLRIGPRSPIRKIEIACIDEAVTKYRDRAILFGVARRPRRCA